LLKLYLREPQSARMNAWRARMAEPLTLTHHGKVEIVNALCLAAFRRLIDREALSDALASFEEDLADGRYVQADILWRATLGTAAELSLRHTA
jgi:hypothetical protein